MTEYDDHTELALDMAETGNVLLIFESRVGAMARFGYHRGNWCLVTETREGYSAQNVDREAVYDALDDNADVGLVNGHRDDAWQWLVREGTDEATMIKSHCMCGAFRFATNVNHVQRWRRNHRQDCYNDPNIIYPDDD